MKCLSVLFGLLLVSLPGSLLAAPLELFVSTEGRDDWSGRQASPNSSKSDGPFATLPTALNAARIARGNNTAPDGITIWLRGGLYELPEPIKLIPEDSGADPQHPLLIAAYKSEKAVLSGGRRVTGWHPVPGKPSLWQADVPAVREGNWYFRQLFINGERKQRARTPNDGFFRINGPSPQTQPVQFKFHPGEIKQSWADDGDVEVIAYLAWADIRMQIRAVDVEKQLVTLSGNPRPSNKEDRAQYYIENAPDALDQPGEWYLERKTGRLTYWAKPGEDLSQAEVIAARLPQLMVLQGDMTKQKPVHDVHFRDITFSHSDWNLGSNGYADTQAAIRTYGDFRAEGAVDCVVEDCTFSHLGNYAVEFGRGCKRCKIIGNEMTDLGGGAVRLGEAEVRRNAFDMNQGHIVTDNHIYHVGLVYPPAAGIFIIQSGQNRVAHNHVHDLFYTAISVGWTWGYRESPCRDNIIEFNHLHDLGQFRLSDMGAVYTLGPQPGTVVRNNIIHDVNSFTYGGWGLYTDEGSTGIIMENNLVYRTKSAGFHQHYGKENIIRNNIFAFGKESQLMRTRAEGHISFFLTNNIVYFDSGQLLGSNWEGTNFVSEANLFFDARANASAATLRCGGLSFAQWKERGHDTKSVFADPLFAAPDQYDFRLRPESPAFKLGFKPIDLSNVGVRPKAQRDDSKG